jgi:predicted transcriptional regulator of viral defense system
MPVPDVPPRTLDPPSPIGARSRSLDPIAQHRAGIVTLNDLRGAGWSLSAVDVAVRNGRLHRIAPGVFRTDGAPFSRTAARHAALAIAPNAVIARRSAAELHGLVDQRRGPVELLLPHRCRIPQPVDELFRASRTRTLRDEECCDVDGLAVTTPARTLLDLAARMSSSRLAEVAAAAFRLRSCGVEEMHELLSHHPRAQGRHRLHEVLELLDMSGVRSRSDAEVATLSQMVAAELPTPVLGHLARDDGGRIIAELDLAYPDLMIAIEVDGFQWHSSPRQKRTDEARQNRLVLAGWTVLRFSAADVRARPHHVVATIRAALEAARTRG